MRQTIAERLAACSNRPSGFDYMRLVLASLVVWTHTVNVVLGKEYVEAFWQSPARPLLAMILAMFFCLSGFLVAGSLERCRTMVSFLGLRIVRLVPALAVDTMISALIIGPMFTTLPLGEYLTHAGLWSYFLNIVGEVHFLLPGVFHDHPRIEVNGQLWTLPYELKCYFVLTLAAVIGLVRYRAAFLACTLVLILSYFARELAHSSQAPHMTLDGRSLVMSFLLGVCVYLYRDRIMLSRSLFMLCLAMAYVLLYLQRFDYISLIFVAYVTAYLGLMTPRRLGIVSSGDYSYGIFLYGWPIQQSVYAICGPNAWMNLAISYPIVVALAVFSWFAVEQPALRLRPYLYALEARIIRTAHAVPFGHWMVQPPVGPWLRRSPARENL